MFDKTMLDGLDFSKMSEMLSEAQKKATELQEAQASKRFEATSGGGLVRATASGTGELLDVSFDDELLADKESLQILIIAAVNDALKAAQESQKGAAMGMLGGMFQ